MLVGRSGCSVLAMSVLLLCRVVAAWAADLPWKIDERLAERLAAEAYDRGKQPNAFYYGPGMSPPFFVFYGLNEPPAEGGFGYFAVNPWTGDVWDLWDCRKLSTPSLRKSKAAVRRRFSREEMKQYWRLARLKPECI